MKRFGKMLFLFEVVLNKINSEQMIFQTPFHISRHDSLVSTVLKEKFDTSKQVFLNDFPEFELGKLSKYETHNHFQLINYMFLKRCLQNQ